ncbi:hypothetical protein PWT90_07966 [Aphanocladium album]|nr:hypothetical protein PWT90_07966 [Aphanocladium album]
MTGDVPQAEDSTRYNEFVDGLAYHSKDFDDADSMNAAQTSIVELSELKRGFLDRLAELLSHSPRGPHVAAAALVEQAGRIHVVVAKNNFMDQKSMIMIHYLQGVFRQLSALDPLNPSVEHIKGELWRQMVTFYRKRLIEYSSAVKRSLLAAGLERHDNADLPQLLRARLTNLASLIRDAQNASDDCKNDELVVLAYEISDSHRSLDEWQHFGSELATRTLRTQLAFLGRLRRCFNTFVAAAERLPYFSQISIIACKGARGSSDGLKSNRRRAPYDLASAFSSLDLASQSENISSEFERKTHKSLRSSFEGLKTATWQVHAEVQVAVRLAEYARQDTEQGDYIGCSRLSCLLCSLFLRCYNNIATRGCHGKIYELWNIPENSALPADEASKLAVAVKRLEQIIKERLLLDRNSKRNQYKESTVGGSNVFNVTWDFDSPSLARIVAQEMDRQHHIEFAVATRHQSRSDTEVLDLEDLSMDKPERLEQAPEAARSTVTKVAECTICDRETSRRCSFCSLDWFCGVSCEEKMSIHHLRKCCARPITSADILLEDAYADELPTDPQVQAGFGFDRCQNKNEEILLFGVYQGLLKGFAVDSISLHKWRERNILAAEIAKKFENVPEVDRGWYYPWFAANKERLFPTAGIEHPSHGIQEQAKEQYLFRILEKYRNRLQGEDQTASLTELEPPAKSLCYLFFVIVMENMHPPPQLGPSGYLWYEFGFATCQSEHDERNIAGLYLSLLDPGSSERRYYALFGQDVPAQRTYPACSFEEFWLAWSSRSLVDLFTKYKGNISWKTDCQNFCRFMSYRHDEQRPSIWRLKHLLALEANTPLSRFPEIEEGVKDTRTSATSATSANDDADKAGGAEFSYGWVASIVEVALLRRRVRRRRGRVRRGGGGAGGGCSAGSGNGSDPVLAAAARSVKRRPLHVPAEIVGQAPVAGGHVAALRGIPRANAVAGREAVDLVDALGAVGEVARRRGAGWAQQRRREAVEESAAHLIGRVLRAAWASRGELA